MKRRISVWSALLLGVIGVVGLSVPGEAHHSFAMFDKDQLVTVEGVVRKIEWTNPHAYFVIEATDATGVTKQYTVECGSITLMARKGWKMNSIKVGDSVSVDILPLKDGRPGGQLVSLTLPNGTVLKG